MTKASGRDTSPLAFSCDCGKLRGTLDASAIHSGLHLVCHCRDCRSFELALGRPDPNPDGIDLLQTTPDQITIEAGAERLGLLRLSPKGLFRWYATCCDTPMFNTLTGPKLAFAGVLSDRLDTPGRLGPVRARGFVPQPGGGTRHQNGARVAWGVISRMLAARVSGRWRRTPFFDSAGNPVAPPRVLTREERAATQK